MDAKAVELRGWLRQQFPQHQCEVMVRGRQLIVSVLSPAWPTDPDPLVRLRCDAGGHWDISYWLPHRALGGHPAVRRFLACRAAGVGGRPHGPVVGRARLRVRLFGEGSARIGPAKGMGVPIIGIDEGHEFSCQVVDGDKLAMP